MALSRSSDGQDKQGEEDEVKTEEPEGGREEVDEECGEGWKNESIYECIATFDCGVERLGEADPAKR